MGKHVAIKCTYNNGGEGVLVGFNGACSEDIIKRNIESGRIWCSQKDCQCRQYYDRGFKGDRPLDPCYESSLFRDWKYGAGWYHTGKRAGTPIHLANVEKGKIAVLTTRFPGDSEEDRKIVGFFKIANLVDQPDEETWLIADKEFAVRLPIEEARELFFWDYYSTRGGATWGTDLVRYLDDSQVARILSDLKQTLHNEKSKAIVETLLAKDFAGINILPASGSRASKSGDRFKRVVLLRKYGYGGEGAKHKALKEWVSQHPEFLGLKDVLGMKLEYPFMSGDAADILFEISGNRYAVVEIETQSPMPGCYQALKYKILMLAQLGAPISSSNVEAFLVAWSIPLEVEDFCKKYTILFFEKKL